MPRRRAGVQQPASIEHQDASNAEGAWLCVDEVSRSIGPPMRMSTDVAGRVAPA